MSKVSAVLDAVALLNVEAGDVSQLFHRLGLAALVVVYLPVRRGVFRRPNLVSQPLAKAAGTCSPMVSNPASQEQRGAFLRTPRFCPFSCRLTRLPIISSGVKQEVKAHAGVSTPRR